MSAAVELAETRARLFQEQETSRVLLEALKLALVVIRQVHALPANSDTARHLEAAVIRGEAGEPECPACFGVGACDERCPDAMADAIDAAEGDR